MAKKRIHAYYSGKVQGIGFRFTAELTARQMDLVGWVKNLADGRVELLCEGEEVQLIGFLSEIKNGPLADYIENVDLTWSEPEGGLYGFEVRH